MHRQAAGPDAADELFIIVRPQLGVEAALEEDAAAAVVLEFLELGGQLVPAQDVAAFGPGRPVKGAEAAAGDANVGVIDVAVDHVGDPGLGVERRRTRSAAAPRASRSRSQSRLASSRSRRLPESQGSGARGQGPGQF